MNSRTMRPRARAAGAAGMTLLEILVSIAVASIVIIFISRFFVNYYNSFYEAQSRMKLQRDMRILSYWIKHDLTALVQRPRNFDMIDSGMDFSFMATDNPEDTTDWSINTTDNNLDRFTYRFVGNKVSRTWDPLGTLDPQQYDLVLESLDLAKGDTYVVNIEVTDMYDSPVAKSVFDATLENFEVANSIRAVEVEIIFSKKTSGVFSSKRPRILERAEMRSVALYKRGD